MSQSQPAGQPVSDTGPMEQVQLPPAAMRVTLRASFLDVAGALFLTALDEAGCKVQPRIVNYLIRKERVFLFASDECLSAIRLWGALALGCNLIFGFVIES